MLRGLSPWVVLYFGLVAAVLSVTPVCAVTYGNPIQISNGSLQDSAFNTPQINAQGQVVWNGAAGDDLLYGLWQVFLYNGSSTTNISNNTIDNSRSHGPLINANGWVVWKNASGIWLRSNGATQQIDTTFPGGLPDLNDSGQIAYIGHDQDGNYGICLYSGGVTTMLTTPSTTAPGFPRINNQGQIVYVDVNGDVRLISGSDNIIISRNALQNDDRSPQINDLGQVTWQDTGNPSKIFFYNGISANKISTSAVDNVLQGSWGKGGQINASGKVVWVSTDLDTFSDIYLYNGKDTKNITNYAITGISAIGDPQINDNGQIVFSGTDADGYGHTYLYTGGSLQTLLDSGFGPVINNLGQIAFLGDFDGQVYLLGGSPAPVKKNVAPIMLLLLDD